MMAKGTIESIVIPRPEPTSKNPQNMSLDKGYDYPDIRQSFMDEQISTDIDPLGEESGELPGHASFCLCLDHIPRGGGFRIGSGNCCRYDLWQRELVW